MEFPIELTNDLRRGAGCQITGRSAELMVVRAKTRDKPRFKRDDGAVLDVGAIDKDRLRRRKRTRDVMRDTQETVDGGLVSLCAASPSPLLTQSTWPAAAGDEQTRQDDIEYEGVGGDKRRHPAHLSLETEPPHPPNLRLRGTTAREYAPLPAYNTILQNVSLGIATGLDGGSSLR